MTYFEDPQYTASDACDDRFHVMSDEEMEQTLGWDAVERGENPDRFLTEADLGGDADPAFPVWTAADAEAFNDWCDDLTEQAQREFYHFN